MSSWGTQRPTCAGSVLAAEFELHAGRGWMTSENSLVKFVNRNDANGYYRALGLSPNASREQIKAAYLKLVKKLHPDAGGDEDLFRFVVDVANVLLDEKTKSTYDSVGRDAVYIGKLEREELARAGLLDRIDRPLQQDEAVRKPRWACLTTSGFPPGDDTDAWVDLCREVAPAVGYRGKIRVGVLEGGPHWPCDLSFPWGVLVIGVQTFTVFQRGIEPNRLYALCAMIAWQNVLPSQVRG